MFGHRPDGKIVKHLNGFYKIIPMIMVHRHDSMTYITIKTETAQINDFITKMKEETGIIYSYLDIVCAAMVRTIAMRPDLNRFVVNKRIYQRKSIDFSLAVQKSLKVDTESNETTIKCSFKGTESILQVKDYITRMIKEVKHVDATSKTDRLANILCGTPTFIMYPLVAFVKWLDKHGLLPMKVLDASPFHSTFFITDMRSIKLPSLYHHLYDFGTTGLFMSTSSEEMELYIDKDGEVKQKGVMKMGFVSDERFCDGYYFSKSFRLFEKILRNPEFLLKELDEDSLPLDGDTIWKNNKREKKVKKKQEKVAKKITKKENKKEKHKKHE